MDLSWERVEVPLQAPLVTSWGVLSAREVLRVTLGDDEGAGEAAPLPGYDPVDVDEVVAALSLYRDALASLPPDAGGGFVLEACRQAADLPWALAAVDLALWDRAGRHAGRPVAALIAGEDAGLRAVPVNATIGGVAPDAAAAAAEHAQAAGFRCVKVKVGLGPLEDAARVRAVRAAAPSLALRLDANGAWSVEEAIATIDALSDLDLELVEEPVHGVEGLRAVAEALPDVTIAADETPGAAGAVAAVCLKIGRCGGISATLATAVAARAAGADVYLASAFDGPIGIAAAVHVAAALGISRPCGLATLVDAGVLAPYDGEIRVPAGGGLLGG